jgi:UDP-N-acetylmuramate: L-alanyl-gamma-D-glutamyl-meso-diaminopimelate ligase
VNLIPQHGYLAVGGDCPAALEVCRSCRGKTETFGLDTSNCWKPANIEYRENQIRFDILYQDKHFLEIRLGVYGSYNIRNALAAAAVLNHLEVPRQDIRKGLETFSGVRRRLQLRATVKDVRIYEDFAHHPTAVKETLQSMRKTFNPERLWAIYEPRSATSRRKIFQQDITDALGIADCIAIAPLFKPEKIPDEERLNLNLLAESLRNAGRRVWNLGSTEGIIEKVCEEAHPGDVIVIMSNGGFGDIYSKLPEALDKRFAQRQAEKQGKRQ